jgi:hypothetical protein
MTDQKNKPGKNDKSNSVSKPDPETLHTTDPQEEMEGPISSIVQSVKEKVEENDDEKDKKKDADQG